MTSISRAPLSWVLLAVASAASCSRSDSQPKTAAARSAASKADAAPLIASVASSTREVVEKLSPEFHKDADIEVKINDGPSNALATQILAGAPVDVFLSASPEWADKLDKEGRVTAKTPLLTNRLVAVVPKGNPGGVHEPKDLASASIERLALAGENVPAGKYADQALAKLGMLEPLTSSKRIIRGEDVRATLSFVERGEVEAGIVYTTDARAAPGVEVAFEFDPALHERIVYVLVLVKNEPARAAARRYYDFLRGSQAADAFKLAGFTPLPQGQSAASK
jgi:molybdate transport system substrate-binding protein